MRRKKRKGKSDPFPRVTNAEGKKTTKNASPAVGSGMETVLARRRKQSEKTRIKTKPYKS